MPPFRSSYLIHRPEIHSRPLLISTCSSASSPVPFQESLAGGTYCSVFITPMPPPASQTSCVLSREKLSWGGVGHNPQHNRSAPRPLTPREPVTASVLVSVLSCFIEKDWWASHRNPKPFVETNIEDKRELQSRNVACSRFKAI